MKNCISNNVIIAQQFATSIMGLLKSIKAREEGRMRASVPNPVPTPVSRVPQQPVGYSRYDQERFKGKEGVLIVINIKLYLFFKIKVPVIGISWVGNN